MMKLVATFSITGLLGLLALELLKILMEPVVAWVLATLALGLKIFLIGVGTAIAVAVSIWLIRRWMRAQEEEAAA